LRSGTQWSVTLNGTVKSSTNYSITFLEPNGKYYFTVVPIKGYSVTPQSGYLIVNGSNVGEEINFKEIIYNVTFVELGLPPNTLWSVTLNGTTKSSSNSAITFIGLPAGTYSWSVSTPISGGVGVRYLASSAGGTLSVPSSTSVSVSYYEQFYVTLQSTPGGTVSNSGGWYDANSTLSITATASSGYRFYAWSSSTPLISITNASSPSTMIRIGAPGTITARFIELLQPTITVSPASGSSGTSVSVTGSGFYPNSTVNVYFNGNIVGSATASAAGSFSISFTAPSMPNGTYVVKATDSYGDLAAACFAESTVTVKGSAVTSASTTAYVENGTASVNATSLGISVKIVGASVPNNKQVSVSVSVLNGEPVNVTPTAIRASGFYDVHVSGLTAGIALINITNQYVSAGANAVL
jgi:hypothetical protein